MATRFSTKPPSHLPNETKQPASVPLNWKVLENHPNNEQSRPNQQPRAQHPTHSSKSTPIQATLRRFVLVFAHRMRTLEVRWRGAQVFSRHATTIITNIRTRAHSADMCRGTCKRFAMSCRVDGAAPLEVGPVNFWGFFRQPHPSQRLCMLAS